MVTKCKKKLDQTSSWTKGGKEAEKTREKNQPQIKNIELTGTSRAKLDLKEQKH